MTEDDRFYCYDLVRRHARDFYLCALFVPQPARDKVMMLFAFDCELSNAIARAIEPMMGHIRLQWWADELTGLMEGKTPKAQPVLRALHAIIQEDSKILPDLRLHVEERRREVDNLSFEDVGSLVAHVADVMGRILALGEYFAGQDRQAEREHTFAAATAVGLIRHLMFRHQGQEHIERLFPPVLILAEATRELAQFKKAPGRERTLPLFFAALAQADIRRLRKVGGDPLRLDPLPTFRRQLVLLRAWAFGRI